MSDSIKEIIEALCSKQKLERDRGLTTLISNLSKYESSFIDCLYSSFINIVKKNDVSWESYHGVLQALKILLTCQDASVSDIHLLKEIREASINLLTHCEVRVRLASGEVLGVLCSLDDCATYVQCRSLILHLIQSNLEKDPSDGNHGEYQLERIEEAKLNEKLNSEKRERRNSGDAALLFHDATRWHNLETSMKCLEYMIKGGGKYFLPFVDKELLELIFMTQNHTNRFVRETGLTVLAGMVSCGSTDDYCLGQGNFLMVYGDQLSKHLAIGLADNWSQVRYAASLATREFLMALPISTRENFFPLLLPRICLNRYYAADGVKLYSQETWRQVTAMEGKQLVEKYIVNVVPYYIEATEADNHSVREAACACIGELALKISNSSFQPYVESLLKVLKICLSDDLWKV